MSKNKDKKMKMGLFKVRHRWQDEWQDMPEFIQEDLTPLQTIRVHFRSWKDVCEFAELINQKITTKTKSINYPEIQKTDYTHVRYSDES